MAEILVGIVNNKGRKGEGLFEILILLMEGESKSFCVEREMKMTGKLPRREKMYKKGTWEHFSEIQMLCSLSEKQKLPYFSNCTTF